MNRRELDELEAVKEAMRRENSERRRKSSSDDSGRTSMPESPQKGRKGGEKMEEERKPSGLINFSAARARQKTQIAAKAATSRGSELLGMRTMGVACRICDRKFILRDSYRKYAAEIAHYEKETLALDIWF